MQPIKICTTRSLIGLIQAFGPFVAAILVGCQSASIVTTGTSQEPITRQLESSLDQPSPMVVHNNRETRQPIVVIPGLQGTVLRSSETDERIWGSFSGSYANPNNPDEMRDFALPMRTGASLDSLKDHIVPDGLVGRFQFNLLRLIPIYADAYNNLISSLETEGYTFEPEKNADSSACYDAFVFTYDWRRDNSENAVKLAAFLKAKSELLERNKCFTGIDRRFDLVTHSMGALVARYFLRFGAKPLRDDGPLPEVTWAGAEQVRNVVFAAPPNAGSLQVFRVLVEGHKYLDLRRFEAAVLGTMPSFYQLLPSSGGGKVVLSADTSASAGNLYDIATWIRNGWGLADPDQRETLRDLLPDAPSDSVRYHIAIEHLSKSLGRARRFKDALNSPSRLPQGVAFHILAGDEVSTESILAWNADDRSLKTVEKRPGDATVLSTSTDLFQYREVPINTSYVPGSHVGMTRRPEFAEAMAASLSGKEAVFARPRPFTVLIGHFSRLVGYFLPYASNPLYFGR